MNPQHSLTVFNALPKIVGQKVKYVNISRNVSAKQLSQSVQLLSLAKVCHVVYHSSCNGVPLCAEVNHKIFKLLFLDVGLLLGACGLTMRDVVSAEDLMLVNSGQLGEQFVGQHLLYRQASYIEPQLHYWLREKASSNAEVDYVISHGLQIIPLRINWARVGSSELYYFENIRDIARAIRSITKFYDRNILKLAKLQTSYNLADFSISCS